MNLQKLFEAQKKLDDRIVAEKGLQGQDLLDKKILALQVELGELANEWQMFKFWKDNPRPNRGRSISVECGWCEGSGWEPGSLSESCQDCNGTGEVGKTRTNDPLLEEYVDGLHFILSIGIEKGFDKTEFARLNEYNINVYTEDSTLQQFVEVFQTISGFVTNRDSETYEELFLYYLGLGKRLGLTWEQVEQAYYKKNKINHERQESGY